MRKPLPPEASVFINDFKGPTGPFCIWKRFEPGAWNFTSSFTLLRDKCRNYVH